ncbi:MAG TPA: hypothetical protein VIM84_11635, partial [Gemmatimonadales bacterium]
VAQPLPPAPWATWHLPAATVPGCPFWDWDSLVAFCANNALTGGDNQILFDGRERSGKTTEAKTFNRYLYHYLHRDDLGHTAAVDELRASATLPPDDRLRALRALAEKSLRRLDGLPQGHPVRYLQPHQREWDFLGNLIFDFEDWQAIYDRNEDLGQHQIDEGGNLLFNRDAMTGESKQVVKTVQMCGVRHATMSWVLPSKAWMDPYIREHRSTIWCHVHTEYAWHGMVRGLASWHWRRDNYMTGNVWWSEPVFWHEFCDFPADAETKPYADLKALKLVQSTMTDTWAKRRKRST